jgi:hypothetical protein
VVREAECQLNDGGDPAAGPALPPEALGFGPTGQQLGQMGQRFGCQAAGSARAGTMSQGGWSLVAGACHPRADRAFADAQRPGKLALGPALLLKVPGLPPSGFLPIVRCLVHAS